MEGGGTCVVLLPFHSLVCTHEHWFGSVSLMTQSARFLPSRVRDCSCILGRAAMERSAKVRPASQSCSAKECKRQPGDPFDVIPRLVLRTCKISIA